MNSPNADVEAWRRPSGGRPWLLGHRGVRGGVVAENTLAAFQTAIDQGADGVELDVRLSGDGVVIVFHDSTLTRVTGWASNGNVEQLPLADIARVDLGKGHRIPRLAEVLEWARSGDHRLNVELKCDGPNPSRLVEAVARVFGEQPDLPHILLSSFSRTAVEALSRRLPQHPVAWLVDNEADLDVARQGLAPATTAIHPQHHLIDETIALGLRQHFAVLNTWTVNLKADVERVTRCGVDAIISDHPAAALVALRTEA